MLKKLCPKCGVIILADQSYCAIHLQADERRQQEYNRSIRNRRDAREVAFYHSSEWIHKQKQIMDKYHGLCLWSFIYDGKIVKADEVHHIMPLKEAWDMRLNDDNLIPLSFDIHKKYEKDIGMRGQFRVLLRHWNAIYGGRGDQKSST